MAQGLTVFSFGGTNGVQWFNDVWAYDPRTNLWSQLDCIGYIPAPREGHSAALVGDVMYIFGGRTEEGTDLGDLAAFRVTSRRWYTFQNMGPSPSPRSGHSMTAYGKQIVVLAGEPSSAPRDPSELSLVYLLDTAKIRYPNDQQIQQTPSGERVPGNSNRRPSGERSAIPQSKGMIPKDLSTGPLDGPKRMVSGQTESMIGGVGPMGRGQDPLLNNGPSPGPGSRLPRASVAQGPPGPPPQQQAPQPRPNGVTPAVGPRSKTPTKDGRNLGPQVDTTRSASLDKDTASPIARGSPVGSLNGTTSPMTNGRRTPTQQPSKLVSSVATPEEPPMTNGVAERSRSRQDRHQPALDSVEEVSRNNDGPETSPLVKTDAADDTSTSNAPVETMRDYALVQKHDEITRQHEDLVREVEAVKVRNNWYASELALARKAGYQPSSSRNPIFDESSSSGFDSADKPLVEALISMRAELAEVQTSVDMQVQDAARKVAEVETQRDAAIREAAYAKAKLAAHGGNFADTPQHEDSPKDFADSDRSADMSRKLAAALALQSELQMKMDAMAADLETERKSRELAEGTTDAAQRRAAELDQMHNPGEIEQLRADLYQAEKMARDEAAQKAEAHAQTKLYEVDKEDLSRQLEQALGNSKQHTTMLGSLQEAMTASTDKTALLQRKLDEERNHRENVEQKLLHLRKEHEERTAELETTTRKLRDAEELADGNANEAEKHRQVVLAGFEKLNSRDPELKSSMAEKRVAILQQQVEHANNLLDKNQMAADMAADKLRRAEERIAGLEAYQAQTSRENLSIRKQLQDSVKDAQSLQRQKAEVRQQFESHQRDASALSVQHAALKELLDERGRSSSELQRSRNFDSPSGRLGTPDHNRLRELEQQLDASERAHQETKASFESREDEAERAYREKIEQLEQDYQSAVHYVKGTEKMLKRMKDELTKYKSQNARLQSELEESQRARSARSLENDTPSDWEVERQSLRREIEEMQESVKGSVSQLERQMQGVRAELQNAQQERDIYRHENEQAQQALDQTTQRAHADLEQLKNENAQLESRALDAEQKVSLLLDQVESSVDNYRRQSQQIHTNGHHTRNTSMNSNVLGHSQSNSVSDSTFGQDNRNSTALDSLASELETLRTHWEGTHRNYRLSSQFDFEKTPTSAIGGDFDDSLSSWRKRLDAEEREKENSVSPVRSSPVGGAGRRVASPRMGEMDRSRGGLASPLGRREDDNVI